MEILSESTADIDRGLKKQIYQDILRTPDYFWFDPETLELAGFHLFNGRYQPLEPNPQGWLWSQQLEIHLGIHEEMNILKLSNAGMKTRNACCGSASLTV